MAELGRPTVMTEETIAKLEEGFLMGLSDREACLYANIAPQTLYNYCKDHTDFLERKEELKQKPKMTAKLNIGRELTKGSAPISQWYLERRDSDFKPKQETDNKGQITIEIVKFGENTATPQVPAPPVSDTTSQSS